MRASYPARGDTVRAALDSIAIAFTQRVELRFTHITLRSARGDTLTGALRLSGDSAVVFKLPQLLSDGDYTLAWRTAGTDGHVVQGTIPFTVVGFPAAQPESALVNLPPVEPDTVDRNMTASPVVMRWLNFSAILLMIGSVVFVLLLAKLGRALGTAYAEASWRIARNIGIAAAVLSIADAIPRLLLQSAMLGSPVVDVLSTNWGRGWVLQVLGSVGFGFSLLAATELKAGAWKLALASAIVLSFGPAFAGHAAAIENAQLVSISADALHVLASSAWLGTLALIVAAAIPIARRTGDHASLAHVVRAFSPLALIAAATAAFTGIVSAFAHLGTVSDLWTTPYGSMLFRKLAIVVLTAVTGFYNWQRVRPRLGEPKGTARLHRIAGIEVVVAFIVLLVTALLVALPTP